MKRILSVFLCLLTIFTVLPLNAFAAKGIINFDITIEQPRVGKQLSYEATLPETSKACVTKVEWDGKLDSNGKIIAGESYTVSVHVSVKDGVTDYQIYKLGHLYILGCLVTKEILFVQIVDRVVEKASHHRCGVHCNVVLSSAVLALMCVADVDRKTHIQVEQYTL